MPSWRIHEKYSGLMGIPIDIAKEVNKLVDDSRWHDFFDTALTKGSTPHLRVPGGRVVTYYFGGSFLYPSTYEPVRQRLEKFRRDGFRAFFLHIYLDLIERNMRNGVGFATLQIIDNSKIYEDYIGEVEEFLQVRIEEVIVNIAKETHLNL
jgi:hypothetical protein